MTQPPCVRSWNEAATTDDVWDGEMVPVQVETCDVLLINVAGEIKAYEDRCPHQKTPLSDGDLADGILTCPSHLWEFDVATGRGVNPPTCTLRSFPVKVEDGVVYVDLASTPQ